MSLLVVLLFSWSNLTAHSFPQMKCSIIDTAGREILPGSYRVVRYVGSGYFLLRDEASTDQLPESIGMRVVNRDGKDVQVLVPKETVLTNLYLPPNDAQAFVRDRAVLPPGTIVEIKSSQGYGLADWRGKAILEPLFKQVVRTNIGLFAVKKDSGDVFGFDPKSRRKFNEPRTLSLLDFGKAAVGILQSDRMLFIDRSHGKPLFGYYDRVGHIAINAQFESASNFDQRGTARVWFFNEDPGKRRCALIDKSGRLISSPEYECIFDFHDDLAVVRVRIEDGTLRYGIIDRKFNYVLQPEWMRLEFLSGNIYFAQRNSGDRFSALTPDGAILFEFPAESFAAKESGGLILCYQDSNPDERRFVKERKNITLLTLDGQTVYSAQNCEEVAFSNGTAVLAQDIEGQSKIEKTCTIITKSGATALGVKAWWLNPVEGDRLVKSVIDPSFSPNTWKCDPNSRNQQFANLLRSYDLIGMDISEVEQLLGPPDFGTCYRNYTGVCGRTGSWIEFRYYHDRVTGWRWAGQVYGKETAEPWVTTDVIFDCDPFPKIGEQPGKASKLKPKH